MKNLKDMVKMFKFDVLLKQEIMLKGVEVDAETKEEAIELLKGGNWLGYEDSELMCIDEVIDWEETV